MPFKDVICTRTGDIPTPLFNPNIDYFLAWYPSLVDEDVYGLAIDLAICKAANATSTVLVLVQASDLSQQHKILDKLKDFLQCIWACEVTSGAYVALIKTVIDE